MLITYKIPSLFIDVFPAFIKIDVITVLHLQYSLKNEVKRIDENKNILVEFVDN